MLRAICILLAALIVSPSYAQDVPIPELARWRSNMLQYGRQHCNWFLSRPASPLDPLREATYYDAIHVYLNIMEETQDSTWQPCVDIVVNTYRDRFVIGPGAPVPVGPNNRQGRVSGPWNFTDGLRKHYELTGDEQSWRAIVLLTRNAAYSADSTPASYTVSAAYSREVAYALKGYLNAEAIGEARRPRFGVLSDQAIDHMKRWLFGTHRAPNPWGEIPSCQGLYYFQPFMTGLTMRTLIQLQEQTGDARVLNAVKRMADFLWAVAWQPNLQAFWYDRCAVDPFVLGTGQTAPDLNLLIAPAYAWLWKVTGDPTYRTRGDLVFAGGVRRAWLGGSKQFNQNYTWSFDYVKWRTPPEPTGEGGPTP